MLEVLGIIFLVILVIWLSPIILGCAAVIAVVGGIVLVIAALPAGHAPQYLPPAAISTPISPIRQHMVNHPELQENPCDLIRKGYYHAIDLANDVFPELGHVSLEQYTARWGTTCEP